MEQLVGLLCLVAFLGLLFALGFVFVMMAASPDYRVLWRTIRRGRFGLKTIFGLLAVSALSLGLMSAFRVDGRGLDFICPLVVTVPLALFLVTFAGLALSEMFDNKSTRAIVARRSQEDELTAFARDRQKAAPEDPPADESQGELPTEPPDAENEAHP